jgi:hypothetical protein
MTRVPGDSFFPTVLFELTAYVQEKQRILNSSNKPLYKDTVNISQCAVWAFLEMKSMSRISFLRGEQRNFKNTAFITYPAESAILYDMQIFSL